MTSDKENKEKECKCEEATCKNDCTKNHTCHVVWCDKCKPPQSTWEERLEKEFPIKFIKPIEVADVEIYAIEQRSRLKSFISQELITARAEEKEAMIDKLGKFYAENDKLFTILREEK